MKHIFTILMLSMIGIFLISFTVKKQNTQSYFINYLMVYKLNLEEVNNPVIPEQFREDFKKHLIAESKMKTYFNLEYINRKSLYQFDRAENLPKKTEMNYTSFYKDFAKKEIYITGGMIGDAAVKETFPKWTYQKDTINLLGYNCQKATLIENKDTLTAWYTTEIPILDGPEHYSGLPGLILKYETKSRVVIATEITKITDKNLKVEIPKFKKLMSGEEFRNMVKPK